MPTSSSSPHLSAAQRRSHLQSPRCTCEEAAARQSGRRASRPAARPPRAPPEPPPARPPPPNPALTLFAEQRNWFKPGGWGKREVGWGWGVTPFGRGKKRKIAWAGGRAGERGFPLGPAPPERSGGGGAGAQTRGAALAQRPGASPPGPTTSWMAGQPPVPRPSCSAARVQPPPS